jgi:predicted acyltransferase
MNPAGPARSLALDVLRGLTLALMIVVNTPGGQPSYGPLEHAAWHGFTLTDLVFPTFLFVVGCAMRLSMRKFAGQGNAVFVRAVLRRGLLICLVGYLLGWFPFLTPAFDPMPLSATRIMGVLQRIGLCYLCAALVVRYGGLRAAAAFSVAALLGYWWLLWRFGDFTLAGNAVRRLDLALLGPAHLYHGDGIAFDPEGILSTLPAVVNVLAGYAAASWLALRGPSRATLLGFALAGAACLGLALAWDPFLPINKKLWTGSFVLITVGWDLLILALLVAAIDMAGLRAGTGFFEKFGKNTLFIYVLADLLAIMLGRLHLGGVSLYEWLYDTLFLSWAAPVRASLLFALSFMLVCWLAAWALDRRKIYVRL